jgi:CelD/BcsL family acetyltransferase involved in cellulose biosynthesis
MLTSHIHHNGEQLRISALAGYQLESPGFASAAMLCTILKHVPGGEILTISDRRDIHLAIAIRERALPLPIAETWVTPLSSSGQPILGNRDPLQAVAALREAISRPLLLREIRLNSEFWKAAAGHGYGVTLRQWQRACLTTTGSYDDWLTANFESSRRKRFKRMRTRLSELGEVKFESLAPQDDVTSFTKDFLALESAGWKGRGGTAIAQSPEMSTVLHSGLRILHAEGKLRFWRITKDGKAIAALFAIVENGQGTLAKIAYDEAYAKFSPGVMIVLQATADLFADPTVQFADSNCVPGHPMMDNLWRERMDVADLLIRPAKFSRVQFEATAAMERTMVGAKSMLKSALGKS